MSTHTDSGLTTADEVVVDVTPESPRVWKRAPRVLEWVALLAALLPIPVAVVRAALNDWMPVGDAALVALRSRDVLTAHHPWQPLLLDVLAPFTKVSPYWGAAAGAALVNAVSVVLVWMIVRRLFRPVVVVVVMAGTLLLMTTMGLSWLIDVRQQFVLVLPLFALLWLSVGMWAGIGWSVPAAVGVASLCVQTHFTYVYQAVLVTLVGAAGFVVVAWRRGAGRALLQSVGLWSGVVAALCWVQPVIEQFFVSGNGGTVLNPARGSAGAGLETGVAVMAEGGLLPPFWLPGSMGSFLGLGGALSTGVAILAVPVWLVAAGLVWRAGRRCRLAVVQAAGIAAAVALLAAVVAVVQIPSTVFGLAPQNYYWLWAVSAFVSLALLAAALSLPPVVARLRRPPLVVRWALPVVVVAGLLVAAMWPRYPVAAVEQAEAEARRIGQPFRQQLAEAFHSSVVDDTVEVNLAAGGYSSFLAVVLVELQRSGTEFRVAPGALSLGDSRCAATGRYQQLTFLRGIEPDVPSGMRVIAAVAGVSADELGEFDELQTEFGDQLRDGTVAVDLAGVEWFFNDSLQDLRVVLNVPGTSAGGLAQRLDSWRRWGMAFVSPQLRPRFDRWVELERRVDAEFLTVVVAPGSGSASSDESC